ncbi:class I SAM-dependent methyltransferase [Siccirubricoccus phaeus]|uniref:class I SAM-dependent methyltransferase n=1 Tax=Siccirubricoccus phaeus TaxID=2595053 RepID=UPI0011F27592|nr:class I SAM-dependent methyltransferase [Siccirubricoccus phaeus]
MSSDAENIVGLYERHAALFAAQRSTALFEQGWLDRFLALLPAGAAVLDLGCGTGVPIARHLLAAGCAVTGVDSSPRMIGFARSTLPAGEWRVADMRHLALGRSFQGILAWDSFFHLAQSDQRAMFRVFRAHAAPGAALLFTSGPAQGEAFGEFGGERLYHASLDPAEYRALLAAEGFRVVAHRAEDPDCAGHTVWLAQLA